MSTVRQALACGLLFACAGYGATIYRIPPQFVGCDGSSFQLVADQTALPPGLVVDGVVRLVSAGGACGLQFVVESAFAGLAAGDYRVAIDYSAQATQPDVVFGAAYSAGVDGLAGSTVSAAGDFDPAHSPLLGPVFRLSGAGTLWEDAFFRLDSGQAPGTYDFPLVRFDAYLVRVAPEPAEWALMLSGLALLCRRPRRRRC